MISNRLQLRQPSMVLLVIVTFLASTSGFQSMSLSCHSQPSLPSSGVATPRHQLAWQRTGIRPNLPTATTRSICQAKNNKNEETVEANSNNKSEKIRSAAAFLVTQLQVLALTKAMEADESSDGKEPLKLLEALAKTSSMGASTTTTTTETPSATKASPKKEPSSIDLKARQKEIDALKTQQILADIDKRMAKPVTTPPESVESPSSSSGKRVGVTQDAKESVQVASEASDTDPDSGTTSDGTTNDTTKDSRVEEKKVQKEPVALKSPELEPEASPKEPETTSQNVVESSTTSTFAVKVPPCISTEFGQALPVVAEGLPPLREPLVAKASSQQQQQQQQQQQVPKTPLVEPVQSTLQEDIQETKAATLDTSSQNVKMAAKENLESQAQPLETSAAPFPPATKEDDQVTDDKVDHDIKEIAKDSSTTATMPPTPTRDDDVESTAGLPKDETKEKPNVSVQPESAYVPPPSKPTEVAAEASTNNNKPSVPQRKLPDDEASKRYASMPLGDRAAAILRDLGMVESTPDPDDPSYDHSKDDELVTD